jgi:hypothetical protein
MTRLARRSALAILTLASLLACDRRAWTGPLGPAADSALASAPPLDCDTLSGDLGFIDARLPLRSCGLVRGDTTYTVVTDSRRRVLILSRSIRVAPSRQMIVHDSLQFALGTVYEAPAICEDGVERDETEVRIWKTLDRQVALKNLRDDGVLLELRTDHPGCEDAG